MTAVVAVGNQKGGVGKTAATLGLTSAAHSAGARVLVVDLDPQANATAVLGSDDTETRAGTFGLLADPRHGGGMPLSACTERADYDGVDLVAADDRLAEVDTDIAPTQPLRLARALHEAADQLGRYDVVLLDCPPSLGRILIAGLVAASHLLIVTEPGAHALRGVGRIEETAAEIRNGFGQTTPEVAGILVNRVKRTAEHHFRETELRSAYGHLVFPAVVPERIAVADAAGRGLLVHSAGSASGGRQVADAFDELWVELRNRTTPAAVTGNAL